MAQDYKHSVARPKAKPRPPGSWLSFVSGLGIGLTIALFVYLWVDYIPRPGQWGGASRAEQEASAPIAALSVDSELRSAVPEPKFDFYKILPEIEVKVPEWEIKSDQSDQEQAFSPGTYVLQVGSFQRYADADRAKAKLALQGIRAKIQRVVINGQDVWFRVHVGPFTEMEKIKTMRMKLIESDMDFILLRIGEAQTT
jgi:cell division protein FtsN